MNAAEIKSRNTCSTGARSAACGLSLEDRRGHTPAPGPAPFALSKHGTGGSCSAAAARQRNTVSFEEGRQGVSIHAYRSGWCKLTALLERTDGAFGCLRSINGDTFFGGDTLPFHCICFKHP